MAFFGLAVELHENCYCYSVPFCFNQKLKLINLCMDLYVCACVRERGGAVARVIERWAV